MLGDPKKLSVSPSGGQFVTTDRLRPPAINTYDMRGDYVRDHPLPERGHPADAERSGVRLRQRLDRSAPLSTRHVYAGWTYDYYFKRFGRRGLDNRDLPLISLSTRHGGRISSQTFPIP